MSLHKDWEFCDCIALCSMSEYSVCLTSETRRLLFAAGGSLQGSVLKQRKAQIFVVVHVLVWVGAVSTVG